MPINSKRNRSGATMAGRVSGASHPNRGGLSPDAYDSSCLPLAKNALALVSPSRHKELQYSSINNSMADLQGIVTLNSVLLRGVHVVKDFPELTRGRPPERNPLPRPCRLEKGVKKAAQKTCSNREQNDDCLALHKRTDQQAHE